MQFLWPEFLWLLLALPLLVLLYAWLLKRKKKMAVRYASLSIVKEAMGGQNWKRHVPPALFLLAMAAMLLAAARPQAVVTLPSNQQTIILAMDVSGSMRATDVQPNRLVAAQNAAKSFIAELPRNVKVGIVAFAGSAQVAQLPTVNREDLITAIDRFQLQRATATGNAIVISLATLFPDQGIELAALQGGGGGRDRQRGFSIDGERKEKKEFTPVAPGSYSSAAIIMLTDGQRTTGVDPLDAAKMAAERGVRVYTVGIGTVDGETIGFEGWSMRMNGMALHGGVIPYGGTFMVFTDYARPAIRLSALQRARVIYVMTHDSIGLGEDGPTHQPIEHLQSLRAIPGLLTLRPADAVETAECWALALAAKEPSILALTRQNLPAVRTEEADGNLCAKGAYRLKAAAAPRKVILIATGSEVEIALGVADLLEGQGVGADVVSMPCTQLFDAQPAAYREDILPDVSNREILRVSIEAGATFGWERYVGLHGLKIGIDRFGVSAPAKDAYDYFGLTPRKIAARVTDFMKTREIA